MQEVELVGSLFYEMLRKEWRVRTRRRQSGGTATPTEKRANRLGGRTVTTVMEAVQKGHLSGLDAYEILDVKPADFSSLFGEINQRKAEYGRSG